MRDIVVVGGGPAGTKAAALLAGDHDVLILEEHDRPGTPTQCTGLISPDVVKMSGVRPDILNTLYGAHVHFPGGGCYTVRSKGPKAVIIDRDDLDTRMADLAVERGAELICGEKYIGHRISDGKAKIETNKGEHLASLIVGADGHSSSTASSVGNNDPKEYLRGIQVDVRNRSDDADMMVLRIGTDVAPGFFSWEIPFGDFTRVGLCTSWNAGPPADHLHHLLKISGLQSKDTVKKYCGKIPIGGRRTSFGDNLLLIGDAAGQVKPISGGGLHPAFKAAPLLKEAADTALRTGDLSARHLSRYEKAWKKDIGKELSRGYRVRKMFVKLSDRDLDKIFGIMDREDIRNIMDNIDLDRPSAMAPAVLRNPVVTAKLLPTLMKAIF
ncbi:MAG: NAD(P)/FAD-dependent oxidoreductase [Candidatus Methanoplasma sp.]|jgi:geranylgeranyl reductase family protein|nr:NAD(P)/FAD-dependent oxidoreductase [Candidatus Methanoplasma sp.]